MSIDNATQEQWSEAARAARTAAVWVNSAHSLEAINRALDRPFGEVDLADRCAAFALWQQGHPVEYWDYILNQWRKGITVLWGKQMRYRILSKPEGLVLPSIDWSHVGTEFKWLAQCENGGAYLSSEEPNIARSGNVACWSYPGSCTLATVFASFKPGKGDWRKLRVQRPEGA